MSVLNEVQEFIYTSFAEYNKALLDQISKLVAVSAGSSVLMTSWGKSNSCVEGNRNRLNAKATRSSTSLILSYRVPWMRLNRTLSPKQLTTLYPRCKKHELAENEEDGKKVWPLEVQCTQIARSISKGISGNTWEGGDKQSKSEFSFLPFPCDFVEDLSKDSFQESKSFELEFEIPVVCAPVVQHISVNGKLFKSI